MPPEMEALFSAKEKACRSAQGIFELLAADQMNHRPSDGTHTPRWNAEHMMGRELGFFSAVYSALDPLLEQMHRHYTEHTANVIRKFDLADWPAPRPSLPPA